MKLKNTNLRFEIMLIGRLHPLPLHYTGCPNIKYTLGHRSLLSSRQVDLTKLTYIATVMVIFNAFRPKIRIH